MRSGQQVRTSGSIGGVEPTLGTDPQPTSAPPGAPTRLHSPPKDHRGDGVSPMGERALGAGLADVLPSLSASLPPAHPSWGLRTNPLLSLWVEAPPKENPTTHTV